MGTSESGHANQGLGHVGIAAPVSWFVGVGQGAVRNSSPEPHVIELRLDRPQTNFNLAQTTAQRQRRESQAPELIETRESPDLLFVLIALCAQTEFVPRQEVHPLEKYK